MNNISGSAEVHDHRYRAHRQGLEDHSAPKLVNRWKDQQVSRSQALHGFTMAQPPTKRDSFVDSKGSREFLKVAPLGAIANDGETCPARLQKRSGRPQGEVTSLVRDEATDEDQFKLVAARRAVQSTLIKGRADAVLPWNKEELLAIGCKLGVGLGGTCDDGRCIAIGRPSERQESVKTPQVRDPLLLFAAWLKPGGHGKPPLIGPITKGMGPRRRKKAKGLGKTDEIGKRRRTTSKSPAQIRVRICRQARHSNAKQKTEVKAVKNLAAIVIPKDPHRRCEDRVLQFRAEKARAW